VFSFTPKGFYPGCVISLVSLAAAVAVTLFLKKKDEQTEQDKTGKA
jgi:uncharacterized membrane protein YfhO